MFGLSFRRRPFRFDSPPRRAQLARDFRRTGWRVLPCTVIGFDLLAFKDDEGKRLAVGICLGELDRLDLKLAAEVGSQEQCTPVVIIDRKAPDHKQREAEEALTLLIDYRDLDELDRHVAELRRHARDRYLEAKLRLQAEADLADGAASQPGEENTASAPEIVYRSSYTQCALLQRGTERLLVMFGNPQDQAGHTDLPEADGTAEPGWSLLCIRPVTLNWFPAHDAAKWKPIVRDLVSRFRIAWAFGVGQGGYGAMRHGGAIGCQQVIAISPVATIDPWDVDDWRYNRYFSEDLHHGMRVKAQDLPAEVVVLHDPQDRLDAAQLAMLPLPSGTRHARMHFAGPATSWLVTDGGGLRQLLRHVQDEDWSGLQRLCSEARKRNPDRAFAMAFALAETRPLLAMGIFERHGGRTDPLRWASVAYRLAHAGQARRVMPFLEEALRSRPEETELQITAALVALEMKDGRRALSHIAPALAAEPGNEKYAWIRETAHTMFLPESPA